MENKIRNLIKEKQTKICLAADLDNIDDIIKLVELVGDKICILKLHYDIIKDNLGQQYSNPKDKQFSDILVIGRAIPKILKRLLMNY